MGNAAILHLSACKFLAYVVNAIFFLKILNLNQNVNARKCHYKKLYRKVVK